MNPHEITLQFERMIADYTGAPYCVCVDNESNALYMALIYEGIYGQEITIPSHTYPSVPCEIINAGGRVKFESSPEMVKGEYQLKPTKVWDSALRFTANMFREGQFQCLSFTGQWKRLKTVKGGAILTDNEKAYKWFKRYRFSGRRECSYFEDNFDFIGRNYYMPHVLASIGLMNIASFYNLDGSKKDFEDLELPYPDLSKYKIYTPDEKDKIYLQPI
jgi:dTDP-4-amino-4,6-dideoxygalactose transaminase